MTDRRNRPPLVFMLRVYAILMGVMTLLTIMPAFVGFAVGCFFWMIWVAILAALIGGMAWIADAPLIRRLLDEKWEGPAALLFLTGTLALGFAMFAVWCHVSTLSYAAAFVLTGAAALHQQSIVRREAGFIAGAAVFPSARLVR